ncbi:hypothetical protein MMC18_007805 [Xylographa bjoerkii]|nr:hypothetical protein [Xylographa bjoerkii]
MEGKRIELYEVPDAPRNDHSSYGPPILPERQVTSSHTAPLSIGVDDETEEDTDLFRRIHFIIQQLTVDIATAVDVLETDSAEKIGTKFSSSDWHEKFNDDAEDYRHGGEEPIISTNPLPLPEELKVKSSSSHAVFRIITIPTRLTDA